VRDVRGQLPELLDQPPGELRWQLDVDPDGTRQWSSCQLETAICHHLRGNVRVIETSGREQQCGRNVVTLEVWKLLENLLARLARGEQFGQIDHANAKATNAGPASALFGANRDTLEKI
jgi:hypothetical protein